MRFRVLGSVELVADSGDGGARVLGAPKLRRLLGALLVHANSVVSVDRLADIVWGDDPPANVDGALQSLISRLRTALRSSTTSGHDGVELLTRSPGYLLRVERRHLDATRFEDLVARAGTELEENPGHAATLLDEALQLWRGNPYAEFADEDFARAEAARLEELHLAAEEDRTEAALALGRHDAAIAVLDGFVAEHPLRERPRRQLMLALHRSGRTAEALRCYRDYRERLDEELGLEPSAALQRLELDILRQDETLQAPPISARPAVRVAGGNLPVAVTDLVGRGEELAAVTSALRRARVVTLTGVGGVGKTRLALAAATQAKEDYPDDVWLCELAAVGHPRAVAEAVTTILGVQQRQGLSVVARLVEFLGPKRLLLVLDNCEHVLDAAAGLVDALARGAPGVTVLATSREPLGVEGEHVRPVPPLAVPQPSDSFAPARAGAVPSVALFCERAEAAWPDFALTAENLGAVAEICRRLDGVPLALELAATRVRSMSLEDIAGRLEARFHFLRSGRRIAEERHRTLRAVVDWSYGLLEEPERRVFERLSVFAGDFDLRAAEQVCAPAGDRAQIADRVAALVDKSMVAVQREDGPTRYRLLETLRHYGRERLDDRGETDDTRRAHADYYVAFVEDVQPRLGGPDEARWVDAVTIELDELRAAHAWALVHDVGLALRLSAGLASYAEFRMTSELFLWAERAVAAADAAGVSAHHSSLPRVLTSASAGARFRGDLPTATALNRRALAAAGDHPRRRFALDALADIATYEGRLDDAFRLAEEAARLAEEDGDRAHAAYVTVSQALARVYGGDAVGALRFAERARRLADDTGNPSAMAWARYAIGETLLEKDPEHAVASLEASIALGRSVQDRFLVGVAMVSAASVRARHGDARDAVRLFGEVIEHWHEAGDWTHQWVTLRNVIGLFARLGMDEVAAVLYGALGASRTAAPLYGNDAERLAATAAGLGGRLGRTRFAAALTRGRAMTDDDAVGFACRQLQAALDGRDPA